MRLPDRPIVTLIRVLVLVLVMALVIWSIIEYRAWRKAQQPFDYGTPTPLADDEPMRAAVCQIREELEALPLPIVDKHHFHEAWTEHKFAAGKFYHRPAHQITLTQPAREFVLGHSRTELIAALAPLLLDRQAGGRAAAILAGLPVRKNSSLINTSPLAEAVKAAQGNDPDAPVDWLPPDNDRYYEPKIPVQLYGLGNMGGGLERAVPRQLAGSFEARLERLLLARSSLPEPLITLVEPVDLTKPRRNYDDMLAEDQTPTADPRFLDYLRAFPRQDILIAVFPLMGNSGQGGSGPMVEMLWANGAQDRFWPMVIGNPLIEGNPYKTFRSEVTTELINMCNSDSSNGGRKGE